MHVPPTTRRLAAPLVLAMAITVAATGCNSNSSNNATTSPASEASLGAPNKATGTPVTIGFINDGKAPTGDRTDETKGAKAAAAYANAYLGGVGGHPIVLKTCETLLQPSAAADCANQMVKANVAAVVEGVSAVIDQTLPVLTAAKIPVITHTAATEAAMETSGVFMFMNGLSYFGTPAAQAKAEGDKSADLVVIAVPAAEGPAQQIGALLYGNAGVGLTVTAIPPGTADMTPQITTADAAHPGRYQIIGDDTFCTSAIKAIKTVEPDAKITAIEPCISPSGGHSIPGGYHGITVVATTNLNPDTDDFKQFSTVLANYGDGAQSASTAAFGYAPLLGLVDVLNAAKISDVNPATVLASLKSAPPVRYPLSGGIEVQCNSKQVALSPNICSTDGILATADENGNLSNYRNIAGTAQLYSMPGH